MPKDRRPAIPRVRPVERQGTLAEAPPMSDASGSLLRRRGGLPTRDGENGDGFADNLVGALNGSEHVSEDIAQLLLLNLRHLHDHSCRRFAACLLKRRFLDLESQPWKALGPAIQHLVQRQFWRANVGDTLLQALAERILAVFLPLMMTDGSWIIAIVQTNNEAVVGSEINAIRYVVADGKNKIAAVEAAQSDAAAALQDEKMAAGIEGIHIFGIGSQEIIGGRVALGESLAGGDTPFRFPSGPI